MNIAQSLGMSHDPQPIQEPPPSSPVADDMGNLFSSLDPAMITRLLPLLGELNSNDNGRQSQLLCALTPYLQKERQERLEKALRMAKLITVGKKMIGTLGEKNV